MMPGALQEWLEAVSIADVIGGLISLGVLVAGLRWLRPIAGGLRAVAEDWKGTPARPGRPAVPGVMEQLAAHAQRIGEGGHQADQGAGSKEDQQQQDQRRLPALAEEQLEFHHGAVLHRDGNEQNEQQELDQAEQVTHRYAFAGSQCCKFKRKRSPSQAKGG